MKKGDIVIFLTIDDVDVKEKTVLVRLDLNSPLGAMGELLDTIRIEASAETVKELSEKITNSKQKAEEVHKIIQEEYKKNKEGYEEFMYLTKQITELN